MAIQFLRGNTSENDGYTGPVGSLTIDTEAGAIRVHDGNNAGGWTIANVDDSGNIESISGSSPIQISGTTANPVIEIQAATTSQDGYMSSADKSKLDSIPSDAEANSVDSVNGKTGAVSLNATDVGAADATHSHSISEVTGLQSELDDKASKNNPTFTGVVTIDEGAI